VVYFVILHTIYLASATCSSMVSYHMALLAESGLYCLFSLLTQCLFYCSISFWAFSPLTLLGRCQEEHRGYLSGARCRLFAYGPADATASQNPVISSQLNPYWFYLSGNGLPMLSWKRGR